MVQTTRRLCATTMAAVLLSGGILGLLFGLMDYKSWGGFFLLVLGMAFILSPLAGLHRIAVPAPPDPSLPPQRIRLYILVNIAVAILGPLMFLYIFGRVASVYWRSFSPPIRGDWAISLQPIGLTLGAILNAAVLVYIIASILRSRRET